MTHEQSIDTRLARIEASLEHIAEDVHEAKKERTEGIRQTQDVMTRLTRLETSDPRMAGLPDRVAHNEAANDVQEAVKAERAAFVREMRQTVYGAVGAVGVLFAILSYFIGGNGP